MNNSNRIIYGFLACLFLSFNCSIIAQPWADCDTIRTYTISLDPFPDSELTAHFQSGLDIVSSQSGIPIKSLGNTVITDMTIIDWFDDMDKVSAFVGGQDGQLPGPLVETIELIKTEFGPDVLILKTPAIPGNIAVQNAYSNEFPRRGWFMNYSLSLEVREILVSYLMVRFCGFTGFDDTEPNLMWPSNTIPSPDPFSTTITEATIEIMNANYQQFAIAPNAVRDCANSTDLEELSNIEMKIYANRVDLFDLKNKTYFKVINSFGQVMLSKTLQKGTHQVWLDQLKNGAYFLIRENYKNASLLS